MMDLSTAQRWLLIILLAAVVIGLLAYARGDEHYRGDEVGSLGIGLTAAQARVA
jgi:hypothetical protein